MKVIYVSSPYSGDTVLNVENAKKYCRYVVDGGNIPIAPHLIFPQFMDNVFEYDASLKMCIELLKHVDEVWVFGDYISKGMSIEIVEAKKLDLPMYSIKPDNGYKKIIN